VYNIVGDDTAVLAVGVTGGLNPVVVKFLPEITGAAIINPADMVP
jgi:hypothetical protein